MTICQFSDSATQSLGIIPLSRFLCVISLIFCSLLFAFLCISLYLFVQILVFIVSQFPLFYLLFDFFVDSFYFFFRLSMLSHVNPLEIQFSRFVPLLLRNVVLSIKFPVWSCLSC